MAILTEARAVLKRPALRLRDIQEWDTKPLDPIDREEEVHHLKGLGVWIAIIRDAGVKK